MANKKNWLGKVQKDVDGYKIRQMATSRTVKSPGGKEKTYLQPTGKYGVYRGRKKLVKGDFKSVAEAEAYIATL
jgi:hypothetical protein